MITLRPCAECSRLLAECDAAWDKGADVAAGIAWSDPDYDKEVTPYRTALEAAMSVRNEHQATHNRERMN